VQYKVTETTVNTSSPTVASIVVTFRATAEQPPNTLIDTRPVGRVTVNRATFTFHGTEISSSLECRLDSKAFAPCTSPKIYTSLPDGMHIFQTRATDAAGNGDPTPTTAKWTIDTTSPVTVILSRPDGYANPDTATFTFVAKHSTATGNTFECKLDGKDFAPCVSPVNYTFLKAGPHTFQVRATDSVGNKDLTPTTARWSVGDPGPNTIIDLRPPHRTDEKTATFTFHATENGKILTDATFECMHFFSAFTPCTSPITISGLGDGEKLFFVRATDAAGLTDTTPTKAIWRIGFFAD
jgi:hypothetical protein